MLRAELIQGCGGPTKVPEVGGNTETEGKGRDKESRNKLLEVIRAPFLQMDQDCRCLSKILQCKQFSSQLLPALSFLFNLVCL